MNQDRLKSPVVWLAILAQVVIVLQITGVLTISDIEILNGVVTSVIQILVLIGILNNPTDKEHF
jgi:phi LC3 family holin